MNTELSRLGQLSWQLGGAEKSHYVNEVASRVLCLYSANDKTSKLKMKFFHSEGHPERFTELHGEEKREEGFRGDLNEMRLNQKRREQASQ